jgi:hypothetical protein
VIINQRLPVNGEQNGEVRNAYRILVGKSQKKTAANKTKMGVKIIPKHATKI